MGFLLEALYFLFPSQTALFLETTLGVSDLTIVRWIMIGLVSVGTIVLLLVIAITIWQRRQRKKEVRKEVPQGEPKVRMSAFYETVPPNEDQTRFDYGIIAGDKHIPALEVQVAYGYGKPEMWANLDLRRYTFEEVRDGKTGKLVKRISLIPHQEYWFTFVSIWAKSRKGNMKVIDPPKEVPFEQIYWKSPYPEVYVRFLGLKRLIEESWVIRFNEPPPFTLDRPPVDLFPIWSPEAKALIAERDKGRQDKDMQFTISSSSPVLGVAIATPILDPRFSRVEAHLFFPWYYFLGRVSLKLGKVRDLRHMPRTKLVISWKTKKALWMGDYAQRLLVPIQKIQWISERKPVLFPRLDKWCRKHDLTYVPHSATEDELLEGA